MYSNLVQMFTWSQGWIGEILVANDQDIQKVGG